MLKDTANANPQKIFASRQQVTAALERAAERARVIAEQTGTQLIVAPAPAQELAQTRAEDNRPKSFSAK
ncbi:MAG: hypothetical protein IPH35_25660 [Rhodoferax sp.]|nr:hypothetical protein [Rhodoferax sp.]